MKWKIYFIQDYKAHSSNKIDFNRFRVNCENQFKLQLYLGIIIIFIRIYKEK